MIATADATARRAELLAQAAADAWLDEPLDHNPKKNASTRPIVAMRSVDPRP